MWLGKGIRVGRGWHGKGGKRRRMEKKEIQDKRERRGLRDIWCKEERLRVQFWTVILKYLSNSGQSHQVGEMKRGHESVSIA